MTNRKTSRTEALALLDSLYELRRTNHPCDVGTLARRLGWGVGRVFRVLGHLDERGVADRERCRLTLTGLTLAVAIRNEQARAHRAA